MSIEQEVEKFAQQMIELHGFHFNEGFSCLIPDKEPFPTNEGLFLWGFSQKRMRFETKVEKFHTSTRIKRMEKMLSLPEKEYQKLFSSVVGYLKSLKELGFEEIGKGVTLFGKERVRNVQADAKFFENNLEALKQFELITLKNPIIEFAEKQGYFEVKNPNKLAWDDVFGGSTPVTKAAASATTAKAPATATPVKATPVKATPMKASPAKATPVKTKPVKAKPVKATVAKATPVKATPVKATKAVTTPAAKATPAKAAPAKATPAKAAPAKATPAKTTPAKAAPAVKATPSKTTPTKAAPATKATPAKATKVVTTPAKATPAKAVPAKTAKAVAKAPTTKAVATSAKAKAPTTKAVATSASSTSTSAMTTMPLSEKLQKLAASQPTSTIDDKAWNKQIDALYKSVRSWLSEHSKSGHITINTNKVKMSEATGGDYEVNSLELNVVGLNRVIFQPVEMNMPGAVGRIDLYRTGYHNQKVMLLLVGEDDKKRQWELWQNLSDKPQPFEKKTLETLLAQWIG